MKKEDDALTIFGVAERDQGSYTCIASTELDQDLAKAHLTVLGNCRCPWPHLPSPPLSAAREAVGPGHSEGSACGQQAGQVWPFPALRSKG